MIVRDIKIEGFKSYGIGEDSIALDRVNVLIGANGAGKSNFISFIELLSAIAVDRFAKYVAENGYADEDQAAMIRKLEAQKASLVEKLSCLLQELSE